MKTPEIDGAAIAVLTEHRGGQTINELSAALRKVAEQVQTSGKAGSVTLKLKMTAAQNTCGTLVITDEITAQVPKPTPRGSIFFTDEHHNLVRNDPNQNELPLKIVDTPTAQTQPLKVVNV
jgi:hypothetical protein